MIQDVTMIDSFLGKIIHWFIVLSATFSNSSAMSWRIGKKISCDDNSVGTGLKSRNLATSQILLAHRYARVNTLVHSCEVQNQGAI
jgi:hypothetical protein